MTRLRLGRNAQPVGWALAHHKHIATPSRWAEAHPTPLRDAGARCFFAGRRTIRRRRTPLSAGRMESLRRGASGMDAARAVKGHGWPLRGDPRSSDGMREVERSETRMQGQDLLVPLGGAGHPATAKRNSPSRAKQMPRQPPPIGLEPQAIRHPTLSCRERHANPDRRFHQAAVNSNRTFKSPFVCA